MGVRATIVGGSGYVGGELLRLLIGHPEVEVAQITSVSQTGKFARNAHPNLRGRCDLKFTSAADVEPCDVLFLAGAHGESAGKIEHWAGLGTYIVDASADFRLRSAEAYERWYGSAHPNPAWLGKFVYGLPEFEREKLKSAKYISGVGCNATAVNLALAPLVKSGVVERAVVDLKVGSSEGGGRANAGSHHPERSGALRSFAPTGHRHQAEVFQALGDFELHFSATAVEMVRGILCTAHVFLSEKLEDKDLWRLYREHYGAEPFVRIVKERTGLYRYPEPKLLAGTNFCDVGFERDPASNRVVVFSALDNMMKGAAGSAVQSMNIALGFDETAGLEFTGLHPI